MPPKKSQIPSRLTRSKPKVTKAVTFVKNAQTAETVKKEPSEEGEEDQVQHAQLGNGDFGYVPYGEEPPFAGGFGQYAKEDGSYNLWSSKRNVLVTEDLANDDLLKIFEQEVKGSMLMNRPMSQTTFMSHLISRLTIEAEYDHKNMANVLLDPKQVGLFYCAKNRTYGTRFRKTCVEIKVSHANIGSFFSYFFIQNK